MKTEGNIFENNISIQIWAKMQNSVKKKKKNRKCTLAKYSRKNYNFGCQNARPQHVCHWNCSYILPTSNIFIQFLRRRVVVEFVWQR